MDQELEQHETPMSLEDEHDLLKHQHAELQAQLGGEVASLRAANIRLAAINKKLLDDVRTAQGQAARAGVTVAEKDQKIAEMEAEMQGVRADLASMTTAHDQKSAKLADLREAVKPLISRIASA